MKNKWLKLAVVACGMLVMVGCGNSSSAGDSSDSKNTSSETAKKENGQVTFYIVRHGKTMLNTTDRVQGWSDAVLTPAGEEVVTDAGKGMQDINFTSAYSSDSGRAIQTAQMILDENKDSSKLQIKTDPRFREFNFGSYEGDLNETMWTDIAKSQGKTLEEWTNEGVSPKNFANSVAALDKDRVEDGVNWPAEDYVTIEARLKAGLTEIAEKESKSGDHNVLLVSHGLSISALIDTLFDGFTLPTGGLKNASVSIITYKDGEFTLGEVNDLSYLEKGATESK
ncbi:histidine phosphatase family protein [Carnobacterium gallinarum]|uniref:histidine phosphatase family protein n=1 Tax=Carnobacterium gallinarum TaxID=2749 RepID=UPI00054E1AFB|nr:histidine phosphatase family protein [Carnobacterium gallinarum]